MSTYVYGLVRSGHPFDVEGSPGVGDGGAPVRPLSAAGVAAAVSDAPEELRAKRRDLIVHAGILDRLMRQGPVLPMRFGTVADGDKAVVRELEQSSERYLSRLDALEGRVEINVKVSHVEEEALREVLAADLDLRRERDRMRTEGAVQAEMAAFGERLSAALEELRRRDAGLVLDALGPHAEEVSSGPLVDGCLANLSLLVREQDAEQALAAVEDMRSAAGALLEVRVNGPLPPYSFVEGPEREEGAP
ncbi:GvpL/GvpF family gas vesicle protein [Nocardiopsis sp. RSe5-2]|uniref:GvpL/GvpF family gas vesicle protein n=1 Tax=Nocardiopsis endophytica TaxID=3018445 RepID=A0ABT4UDU3_9ACTN|nr:GvpL/GvpF family gas vesicle protein [Nocardiopsis endophytica]MDA2814911.1 GvpL/GvpF family gas vesicle protein [Nocardiopsis endophytica]